MGKAFNSETSDQELLSCYLKAPNSIIIETLYNRYYQNIFYYCLFLLKDRDDAFDLTQEAFIRSFDKIRQLKKLGNYEYWLRRIAHNRCINFLKKKRKERNACNEIKRYSHTYLAEVEDTWGELVDKLELALFGLSEKNIEILELKYQKKKSIQELQDLYGISASAVKMRLARARGSLMEQFENLKAA